MQWSTVNHTYHSKDKTPHRQLYPYCEVQQQCRRPESSLTLLMKRRLLNQIPSKELPPPHRHTPHLPVFTGQMLLYAAAIFLMYSLAKCSFVQGRFY